MTAFVGKTNVRLQSLSRVRTLAHEPAAISARELMMLALAALGAAAATVWLHLDLQMPGHAILRSALPLMVGLALVPRRYSGSAMSAMALLFSCGLLAFPGTRLPLAAGASMVLLGPAIDLVLAGGASTKKLYVRFAVAGALANCAAYVVKIGGAALLGMGGAGRSSVSPISTLASYIVCGAMAGLVCGAIVFRNAQPTEDTSS
jgi:hypothetical protein